VSWVSFIAYCDEHRIDGRATTRPKRSDTTTNELFLNADAGAGAAGIRCALALSESGYDVHLIEANPHIGGHARAAQMFGGKHIRNPGVQAFEPLQWPNAIAFIEMLGGKLTQFEVHPQYVERSAEGDYRTVQSTVTAAEKARYMAAMFELVNIPEADGFSIGEWLIKNNFDTEFAKGFLVGTVIHLHGGYPLQAYLSYPARLVAWLSCSMTANVLLSDTTSYMKAAEDRLRQQGVKTYTGARAEVVKRSDISSTVKITTQGGVDQQGTSASSTILCGHLVLAAPPHSCVTVLGSTARADERSVLSSFVQTKDTVVFHQDQRWLPNDWVPGITYWAHTPSGADASTVNVNHAVISLTDNVTPVICTYDYSGHNYKFAGEQEQYTFTHITVTAETQRLRVRLDALQGQRNTHYIGAWINGIGLHEDAIVSGLQAANKILQVSGSNHQLTILPQIAPLHTPFCEPDTPITMKAIAQRRRNSSKAAAGK